MAPLTDRLPKALIPVRGRPLLGHVMDRLVAAGAKRVVVNTSRYGEQIADWLAANTPPGVEILLSPEPDGPYDTGGGLAAAAHLFKGDGPIILHNVDILSRIPLDRLVAEHVAAKQRLGVPFMASLAVQQRDTKRRVLFDDAGMVGWGTEHAREPVGTVRDLAFAGIHVIEAAVLKWAETTAGAATRAARTTESRAFPIRDVYLNLVASGYIICPSDVSQFDWLDVGTPERLQQAETIL